MSTTPILELPPDVDLPASAASELNMRLLWIGQQLKLLSNSEGAAASGVTVVGTRNQRLNIASYDAGNYQAAQFVETDTGLVYVSAPLTTGSSGYIWKYLTGTARAPWSNPLASNAAFVKPLDSRDAGLLLYLTDKARTMRWSGSGWTFAPAEVIPVGFVAGFKANPGTGWQICDGSTVNQLNADGTVSAVTVDDLTSAGSKAVYPKWGPAAGGVQVAIAPGFTGALGTDDTSVAVQSGAGTTVAAHTHSHGLGTLAVDTTGEPRHYALIPYQRI